MTINLNRMVTSQQVADRAGVSRTTVSLVLNQVEGATISDSTRERVLQVAREMGYIPDRRAQTLAAGSSPNVGFINIQPSPETYFDPYVPTLLTGVSKVMVAQGRRIVLENVEPGQHTQVILNMLRGREVGGIITHRSVDVDLLEQAGVRPPYPIVLLDGSPDEPFCTVSTDQLGGVRQLLEHLLYLGHRHIACIPYTTVEKSDAVQQRLAIYRESLTTVGVHESEIQVEFGDYLVQTGYAAMQRLLTAHPRPTAVYAMNDTMALGALRAIHDAKLHVPHDIAVVGYDDHRFAAWMTPALTSVHIPFMEQGQRAAEMLLQLMRGVVPQPTHVQLSTELMVRESCGVSQGR